MVTQGERLSSAEAQIQGRQRECDQRHQEISESLNAIKGDLKDIKTCLKGNGAQGLTTRVALLEDDAADNRWLRRTKIGAWIAIAVSCASYAMPNAIDAVLTMMKGP